MDEAHAYLAGAMRDGTFSKMHGTTRISQSYVEWLELLAVLLARLGRRSWIYRESPHRSVWTIETSLPFDASPTLASRDALRGFARGYFDADGGVPRDPTARFYIQVCQKDLGDLLRLRSTLEGLGIVTGRVHNPSARIDPDYWRLYVAVGSHERFSKEVGSWHPVKRAVLRGRFGS